MGDLINGKFKKIENFEEHKCLTCSEEYEFLPDTSVFDEMYLLELFAVTVIMVFGITVVIVCGRLAWLGK